MNNITIGIMQGRLMPPVNGQLQAFPGKGWEKEFSRAGLCGLDTIEFIFDTDEEYNPLHDDEKIERIRELSRDHRIKVSSVCADYFMRRGFLRVADEERKKNVEMLRKLTLRCDKIGIRYIVIPFVDESEIKTAEELYIVRDALIEALDGTKGCDVYYALEMSLPAGRIVPFLKEAGHPRLKINYDTGNSTALGYDLASEIEQLAPWIVDVHIKDRKVGGGSCILGEGDTDFDGAFRALAGIGFRGPYIIQAQRTGNEAKLAKRYLGFVKNMISRSRRAYSSHSVSKGSFPLTVNREPKTDNRKPRTE